MEHTATPYRLSGAAIYDDNNAIVALVTSEAAGEFIIRACNSHHKLADACKEAADTFATFAEAVGFAAMGPECHAAIEALREAIADATS